MSAPTTPASPDQPDQANELDQLDRDIDAVGELDYETLAARSHALRERLNRFRTALGHYFVERQSIIDLMTICAIAQEPLLLVGVPGTAKSDLVTKFRDALGIPSEDYFEYMLTRFTEPSEVMGPIDINLLREGRYIRRAQGKLPTARMVFLDEIFKSNSAILNSLLTIINERKFYQDGTPVPVALEVLIAATNEIPEHAELAALKDRFCLKIVAHPVQDEHFFELIDAGLDAQTQRDLAQKPWVEGHASLVDLLEAHRYLSLQMARRELMADGQVVRDRHRYFSDELLRELHRLLKTLAREDGVFVSDRKVVKLYKLLRTRAWLLHGGKVEREDLALLAYLGETREELALLEDKVPKLLGLD
ncbi:AAA family ATPase [Pseudenhygromyxa sp. WMMC2535]|uniref:AAA family ATPase n=1 Tax=Pseudenhygromyxa sp. WMMC2535 TaxID=2712867 RepID=UPI00155170F0|nr:AAA family ATPase [Pseudenhygromyxa sp. WMMC2535]NVB40348.1 AAA family ATPase [Pseudenhygromyxa sp. WMMC2535]NVB43542.1 AAA family ATPase [Pseudenhygromyxa sp. WMMC2535]